MGRAELEQVLSLAEPLAGSMDYEILKAEFVADPGGTILRIYLDRPEGEGAITLADCEGFSRNLSPILDVEANLSGRYHLEISSPGLNRPLAKPRHFQAQIGKIIEVTTEDPIESRRHFRGELTGLSPGEDEIQMRVEGREFHIPLNAIKKAHLDYFAGEERLKGGKKQKGFRSK